MFRDAAEAHRHGELRVAIDSARRLRHTGWGMAAGAAMIVSGLGRYGIPGAWWSPQRQTNPRTWFGTFLRITDHSGAVLKVPWEVVAAAALMPIGIALAIVSARRLARVTEAFAKEFKGEKLPGS